MLDVGLLADAMRFHLLPFFRLEYDVNLSVDETQQLLRRHLQERRSWSLFLIERRRGYEGVVFEDGSFRFNRIISYRNSFLPFAYGRIGAGARSARVRVFASLHPAVAIGVLSITAVLTFGLVRGIYTSLQQGHVVPEVFGTAVMLAFLYVLTMACFWPEAYMMRRFFLRVFGTSTQPN